MSNVVLNFDICQDNSCKFLTFDESTGAYATNNQTGWNSPNNVPASIAATSTYSTASWTGGSATFNLEIIFNFSIGGISTFIASGQSTITGAINTLVTAINTAANLTIASYSGTTLSITSPIPGTIGNGYAYTFLASGSAPTITPTTGTFSGGVDGATSSTLTITDPSNNPFIFNLFSVTPNWPTTDETQLYYIYPINLNQGNTKFLDGLYQFVYTVINSDGSILSTTQYKLLYCNIKCCVNKMGAQITDVNCDCQEDQIALYTKANGLLDALICQAEAANVNEFNATLAVLNRLCTNINCDSCS